MRTTDRWLISLGWALCFTGLLIYLLTHPRRTRPAVKSNKRSPKPLQPCSDDDGAWCRTTTRCSPHLLPADPPPPPWSSLKSRRGCKKSISTAGYACQNPACAYRLITKQALVADGSHGRDRIRTSSNRVGLAHAL